MAAAVIIAMLKVETTAFLGKVIDASVASDD